MIPANLVLLGLTQIGTMVIVYQLSKQMDVLSQRMDVLSQRMDVLSQRMDVLSADTPTPRA